jgi:S1-C subfamily serine protease
MKHKKRWMIALGAVTAAAALLLAPDTVEGQKAKARAKQPAVMVEADADQVALEKLHAELARVQEQIAAKLAAVERRAGRHLEQQLASLEGLKELELSQALAQHEAKLQQELAHVASAMEADQAKLARELAWAEAAGQEPQVWISGESESGWLGVSISEVSAEKAKELKLPSERGALITEIISESPASKAGLKANDVITEFAGQRVEGTVQLRRFIRETPPGRTVQLTVWRDGRAQQVSVTLEDLTMRLRDRIRERIAVARPRSDFSFGFELPQLDAFRLSNRPTLGIQTQDLDGQLGSYFGAPGGEGVLVEHVNTHSPAEKAGMKAGDVITKVEGARVRTTGELRERLREHREKKTVAVTVLRKGTETTLHVEIEQPAARPAVRSGRRIAL